MKLARIVSLVLLVLILAGCSGPAPTGPAPAGPTATPISPTPPAANPYPAGAPPAAPENTAYPAPADTTPQAVAAQPVPTADPTKGSVSGQLLTKGQPVANIILYLARVIKSAEGKEVTLHLDKTTAPYAVTDASGKFTFYNVPPETYGIVVDTVLSSYLLPKVGSDEQIRVIIDGPKKIDLGAMDYPDLPLG